MKAHRLFSSELYFSIFTFGFPSHVVLFPNRKLAFFFSVSVVKVLVGGVTVNIPSIVWNFNSIYGGGVLFDTGTSLGYLDKRAWLPIFTEVDNQISAQNYEDVDQYYYYAGIHFCWLNSTGSRFPTIEFQFEGGAKLRMDPYIVSYISSL